MKYNSRSFSDKKLEKLSVENKKERGNAPWFEFSSEIYSMGKTFRRAYKFPKFLSLPIASDHGVNIQSTYDEYERNSKGPFFTWNLDKYKFIKRLHREVYFVPHPWIEYKNKHINFKKEKSGTIIFFPKSTTLKVNIKFLDQYMKSLKKLPKKCKPISICLFFHDIKYDNLHKKIRKYNFPIVTAGYSSSKYFVDRFYDLISNFKYASSPLGARPSSNFFFCIEAGIPFFFHGRNLEYISDGTSTFKKGKLSLHKVMSPKYGTKKEYKKMLKIAKNFNNISDKITPKQKKIIHHYLGLNAKPSKLLIFFIIWKSFILNIFTIIKLFYFGTVRYKFQNLKNIFI